MRLAAGLVDPAGRKVVLDAPDAVEVGVEAPAGRSLDLVEHVLAIAEGVEHRGDGAELHAHVAQEQGDVGDAGHLEEDRADPLGPRRGLDLHQLLAGEDERHFVGEAAEPVDPVDERGHLGVGAHLGQLLVAAMHVAHDRVGLDDLLAVEAGHDPQRAVGGGVLGTDVEGHALGFELDVDPGVGSLGCDVGQGSAIVYGGHDSSPLSALASDASPAEGVPPAAELAGSGSASGIGSTSTMPGHGFTIRASSG